MRTPTIFSLLLLAGAGSAAAQETAPATPPTPASSIDRIRAAMRLPERTAEAREAGVPDTSVRSVMDVLRRRNVDPVEADQILTAQRDAARENGPTDNFGAFVEGQLASGKRGRELAEAIHAEHRAHGKGKGHGAPGGQGQERSDPAHGQGGDDHGKAGQEHGKPTQADSASRGGRPGSKPPQGQSQQGRGRRPN